MNLSIHHLRTNEYTHCEEEVPEGTHNGMKRPRQYGFWRIVEHTGAGWFPWPGLYRTKKEAERAMAHVKEDERIRNAYN
jgi:hypothetical protein